MAHPLQRPALPRQRLNPQIVIRCLTFLPVKTQREWLLGDRWAQSRCREWLIAEHFATLAHRRVRTPVAAIPTLHDDTDALSTLSDSLLTWLPHCCGNGDDAADCSNIVPLLDGLFRKAFGPEWCIAIWPPFPSVAPWVEAAVRLAWSAECVVEDSCSFIQTGRCLFQHGLVVRSPTCTTDAAMEAIKQLTIAFTALPTDEGSFISQLMVEGAVLMPLSSVVTVADSDWHVHLQADAPSPPLCVVLPMIAAGECHDDSSTQPRLQYQVLLDLDQVALLTSPIRRLSLTFARALDELPSLEGLDVKEVDLTFCDVSNITLCCTPTAELVRLPQGSVSIGRNAFFYATNIASIDLSSPRHVEVKGFRLMTSLREVLFPQWPPAPTLKSTAFSRCSALTTLDLGHIHPTAVPRPIEGFQFCANLACVVFPPHCHLMLGSCAFHQCTGLRTLDFSMCDSADIAGCQGCTGLNEVHFPRDVVLHSTAFEGCSSLASIDLSECRVPHLDGFRHCGLTSIKLPEGFGFTVRRSGFQSNDNLTVLDLSRCREGNSTIEGFQNCRHLRCVILPPYPAADRIAISPLAFTHSHADLHLEIAAFDADDDAAA